MTLLDIAKTKFSFRRIPYAAQIYPVLLAHEKILDVISILFRRNGITDGLPRMVHPHEVLTILHQNIHIEQALEDRP